MTSRALTSLLLALAGTALSSAHAATVIDFEGPTSFESVLGYYDGSVDGAGVTGPVYGVVFGGDALALRNDDLGSYFSNAPSPVGVMFAAGPEATMNVAMGFKDAISFSYSSSSLVISAVNVYSGLDGTGTLLASFNLAANAQVGCNDTPYCRFDTQSSTFGGIARSVTFGAAADVAAFDNITITAVPEPTTALMFALGGIGLLVARRRA